jgi:hypothetical protein
MLALAVDSALEHFLRDQDDILKAASNTQTLRDMDPWLEYYFFRMPMDRKIQSNPEVIVNFENRVE